jgi:hypothetical protein
MVQSATGEKGADVTAIQPGVTRAKAEAILGQPVREWIAPTGIRYTIYSYDAGRPPRMFFAVAYLFLDLSTVGISELMIASNEEKPPALDHITDRVVLSYDARDVILGLFDEFDTLPPDGRSSPRRWDRAPPQSEK